MKRREKMKRAMSAMLAGMTLAVSILSPFTTAYAAESVDEKPPLYEEVKDLLDADEVVIAKDLELEYGSAFDVKKDFTNLEIKDETKVKVTFEEAKNDAGEEFTTEKADTYKAVYYVEPVNEEHPIYQVSRNLIVKQPVTEIQTEVAVTETEIQTETVTETVAADSAEESTEDEDSDSQETELEMAEEETASETEAAITEPVTEALIQETELIPESGTESSTEELQDETENVTEEATSGEAESESNIETEDFVEETELPKYQVFYNASETFTCLFNREELLYEAGEEVRFSIFLQEGFTVASITAASRYEDGTSVELDILYDAEDTETFYFVMPETDVELMVECADADQAVMLMAEAVTEEENEDPVPDKFKLINTGSLAAVPDSYQSSSNNDAATQIRKVVFTDEDGNKVTRWAFCMQPNLDTPPGGTYDKDSDQVEYLETGSKEKNLAKCLYYMYGGPAWGKTIDYADGSGSVNMKTLLENHGCSTNNHFFAVTHYVLGYIYVGANGNWNANSGVQNVMNSVGKENIALFVSQIKKLPTPKTELSTVSATAAYNTTSGVSVSETIKYSAIDENTATVTLPDGVVFVNETTGERVTGKVTITGGTKFHLEASPSVTGTGSYTLKCKYAVDFTALALKTPGKQDIGFSYYSGDKTLTFSVEWPAQAKISIVKKDAATGKVLSGAVYGVYSDAACTNLIEEMPATDGNGVSSVTLNKTQETVYLKEIIAPAGYIADAVGYGIKLIAGGTTSKTFTDKEPKAAMTIYKTGEVLTGANVSEQGVSFVYTEQYLKDAKYNVYAGADIVTADGTVVYKKDALVAENLTTGNDGKVTLDNLTLGTYVVKEVQAPTGYLNNSSAQTVTLKYADQNTEVIFADAKFKNERQKAKVIVTKEDIDTKNPLDGGIYGLYAGEDITNTDGSVLVKKDTFIEKAVTKEDGTAAFTADLPIGFSWYVKEMQAPAAYVRNTEDIYEFAFVYTNEKETVISFSYTFLNDHVNATLSLVKKDKETGAAQGDAVLNGAVYGLYAREDIMHPDGSGQVLYKAESQVAELITDEAGTASVEDLYLGSYYVKEIKPSTGYLLDETEYDVVFTAKDDLTVTVEAEVISDETVMKQPFQIIKAANDGNTDAELLSGAGFTVYLESSLAKKEDGKYDFSSAKPVVITADGGTEMFTDKRGYACSIALPYGTYVVRETTTPHNFKPVNDFTVTITKNAPDTPQVWRVLLDEEFKAKLKVIKKDDETKQNILIAGTEFKIYDMDAERYVEQVTTYPVTTKHKSYFTDSKGYLILPNNLQPGRYRIEEVSAPEGYTINTDYVEVVIDANSAYQFDDISNDVIIEAVYENHPVKGRLIIEKQGEVLSGFRKDFEYKDASLAGAVFEIYAAEDIYTPDYQKDEAGNRILVYAKDALAATASTGEDGMAAVDELPLGKYYVKEVTAPNGFVLNTEIQEVEFAYDDQSTPVIEQKLTFVNERQRISITAVKCDASNDAPVAGAVFNLICEKDIIAGDKVIVQAGTILAEAVTGTDGKAVFALDLPFGDYYVTEKKAPDGYVSSEEILTFEANYQGQDIPVVELEQTLKNEPTRVQITKADITTSVELEGATLTVLDKEGNIVDQWTSSKDEPHLIERLVAGESYILREEIAPYGYLRSEDVEFTVSDTLEVQKVEMKDAVPTALLIINKEGEFLDKVTLLDSAIGTVEHFFGYISGGLQEVTFEVYAAEDIKAADGVSDDYFKADELVATITTDANGIAQLGDIPVGKYYVKEVETAHGYVLDGEPRYVDLSYRDQNTPVVTYDEAWQNARQRAEVIVWKKETGTERYLEGGVFGLFTRNDIVSVNGTVLMEADTLIEQKATDANGQIVFAADLPVDGVYYVKEITAPDGFVTDGEEKEFTFEYAGSETEKVSYEFTFENTATTVELTKADLVTCEEIPGAHLEVTDEDGTVVDEWVSTEEPHSIKELVVGKEYTLTERIPANGYVTAESVTFVIENTAEIQKQVMYDDVTKLLISKTDITGDQEIPGAKLTILDKDDQVVASWISSTEPHYIEKLPIGQYTLREEQAPKGYVLTEDVSFEVRDTGDVQTVVMKNDTAKGKVILNKTDSETGEPLKGVEFELRSSKGKVLETLKTDAAGHAESSLYEIATYEDGKFSGEKKYYLVETKTLDGYTLDKEEREVIFTYKDDNTPVVEVTFELTNEYVQVTEPSQNTPSDTVTVSDAPKTGDETNLWIPLLLLAVSIGGMVGILAVRRKRK